MKLGHHESSKESIFEVDLLGVRYEEGIADVLICLN
jgi:hypothetical protein